MLLKSPDLFNINALYYICALQLHAYNIEMRSRLKIRQLRLVFNGPHNGKTCEMVKYNSIRVYSVHDLPDYLSIGLSIYLD